MGIDAEVIDLRSLVPLDRETVLASIRKTGRLVVADDDYQSFGVSGEIIAIAGESAFASLKSAPARVAFPDIPIPFSPGTRASLAARRREDRGGGAYRLRQGLMSTPVPVPRDLWEEDPPRHRFRLAVRGRRGRTRR